MTDNIEENVDQANDKEESNQSDEAMEGLCELPQKDGSIMQIFFNKNKPQWMLTKDKKDKIITHLFFNESEELHGNVIINYIEYKFNNGKLQI